MLELAWIPNLKITINSTGKNSSFVWLVVFFMLIFTLKQIETQLSYYI